MEDINNIQPTPPRRRKRKTKWQIFKEAYLPVLILTAAFILVISFIAGAVTRGKTENPDETDPPSESQQSQQSQSALDALLAQAEELANKNDYEGALRLLRGYTGEMGDDDRIVKKIQEYTLAYNSQSVLDPTQIPILSFNTLIADLSAAKNVSDHITTAEFSAILQQLYDGGYVLVGAEALSGEVRMSTDKKPILLVLTDANYTGEPGFASRLSVDDNGALICEMDQENGAAYLGNYDLIPILNDFVAKHPDFSHEGARALIALSGKNGVFGYPADSGELESVISAVKAEGYDFASYGWSGEPYGALTAEQACADADLWLNNIGALVGKTDILVYPYGSDFTDVTSTEQLEALNAKGFTVFIGTKTSAIAWGEKAEGYLTVTRRWVNTAALTTKADKFADVFTAAQVLDEGRNG